MADKYLFQNAGVITEKEAKVASAGVGDAGKVVALDATGKLDSSMMPVGIGADTNVIQASEALAAGDLVNIHDVGGNFRVRKADGTTAGKHAMGFVLAGVANAANATVYSEGSNTQMAGLTPGDRWLSVTTPGQTQTAAPAAAGQVVQRVGVAVSATVLNFDKGEPIVLA